MRLRLVATDLDADARLGVLALADRVLASNDDEGVGVADLLPEVAAAARR